MGVLSDEKFREYVDKSCAACGELVAPEKFRDEIVKTVCLMQQDGLEYSFVHKSVVQYYAASFVKNSSDDFSEKFYGMVLRSHSAESWGLELKFLSQIDSYRYSLKYEIPYLNEICTHVGLNFNNKSLDKSFFDLLIDRASIKIGTNKKKNRNKLSNIIGWSYRLTSNVIDDRVLRLALLSFIDAVDKIVDTDFWKIVSGRGVKEKDDYFTVYLKDIEYELRAFVCDFDEVVKNKIVDRFIQAEKIIKIEKDKVDALAAFL